MWWSFLLWINRKSQEAIVRNARLELARHMSQRPPYPVNMYEEPPYPYSQWEERKMSLTKFLRQEEWRLTMIGGDSGSN